MNSIIHLPGKTDILLSKSTIFARNLNSLFREKLYRPGSDSGVQQDTSAVAIAAVLEKQLSVLYESIFIML